MPATAANPIGGERQSLGVQAACNCSASSPLPRMSRPAPPSASHHRRANCGLCHRHIQHCLPSLPRPPPAPTFSSSDVAAPLFHGRRHRRLPTPRTSPLSPTAPTARRAFKRVRALVAWPWRDLRNSASSVRSIALQRPRLSFTKLELEFLVSMPPPHLLHMMRSSIFSFDSGRSSHCLPRHQPLRLQVTKPLKFLPFFSSIRSRIGP
ncbi:hypothetical protein KSP40_PGU013054 [Platanthera guangdongensis]|uniref:Uncharacterized protein n=1 Tax=Platanthera guangdongensis TaxID=2320717 RepID=A0ABR2LMW9_9ASPA